MIGSTGSSHDELVEKGEELEARFIHGSAIGSEERADPFPAHVPRQAPRRIRQIALRIGDPGQAEIDEAAHLATMEQEIGQ